MWLPTAQTPQFFDGVVSAGTVNGVIAATLVGQRPVAHGEAMKIELFTTAQLRTSLAGAKELVAHLQAVITDAEQAALLHAAPTGPRN